jgi:hypothetical protein
MRRKAAMPMLEDGKIAEQRHGADHDDDDTHDLSGTPVDRQIHENPRVEILELIPLFADGHNRYSRSWTARRTTPLGASCSAAAGGPRHDAVAPFSLYTGRRGSPSSSGSSDD